VFGTNVVGVDDDVFHDEAVALVLKPEAIEPRVSLPE